MEMKLRQYMDELFQDVPINRQSVEIKEEILQNITDKYHDLLNEGKSEEAAYNIAIAGIGDLSDLLQSLSEQEPPKNDEAVIQYNEWKKASARRIAIAVMLYIMSVIPPIIIDMIDTQYDNIGAVGLCIIAGIATAILVYNHVSKPINPNITLADGSVARDFKNWQDTKDAKRKARKDITGAMWAIIFVLYFIISFTTGAWHITWIMFLIGVALKYIIRAIFTLTERGDYYE